MQSHNPTLPIHTATTLPATTQSHSPTQSHSSSTHSSPSHHQPATNISSSSRQQNTTSLASGRTLPIDNTQGEACSSFADLDPPPVYEMSAKGQLTPSSPSSTQNLPTSSAHIEPASSLPSGTSGLVHTSDSLPPMSFLNFGSKKTFIIFEPSIRYLMRFPTISAGYTRSSRIASCTAVSVRERGLCTAEPLFGGRDILLVATRTTSFPLNFFSSSLTSIRDMDHNSFAVPRNVNLDSRVNKEVL
nr:hypothetical protein Iba_chr03aCG6020 [Ipomoea batatas]